MKSNFRVSALVLIFFFSPFLPRLNVNADSELPFDDGTITVSMDFQDANLKDILKVLSIQSGLNFIASEAVQNRKVTLYLDKVKIKEAMDKLFKANNLTYELDRESNIFLVKDWGKPEIETITKVFYLKHATVSSSSLKEEMANKISEGTTGGGSTSGKWATESDTGITKTVKKLLTSYGSLVEDYRTNSLIVTDVPSRMPVITKTIAALDVPVPQVMLEVEMLDVSKGAVDKLGIKFGSSTYPSLFTMILTGASRTSKFPFYPNKLGTITEGSVDFSSPSYTVLLDFFKSQSDTKYLARPRILTLNNETAEIKITTQETIGTTSTVVQGAGTTTATNAERVETGVSLRVTPQINTETGEITMFIMPVVKEATANTSFTTTGGQAYKDPEERSTKTTVRIKDGETVILGGLIRNKTSQTITKLPIFGDLPILGILFRHKNKDIDTERELLVFITPHIMKENNIALAQAKKVALPEREQTSAYGNDRQAAINKVLNNFAEKE